MSAEVTPQPAESVWKCFEWAKIHAGIYQYKFGGGHPGFGPSLGGYDCSAWVSAILHAGGILNSAVAMGTHELEHWGDPGEGRFLTVWVHNGRELEHCFIQFRMPGHADKQFSQAAHTGTICGWYQHVLTAGYTPRRRKP